MKLYLHLESGIIQSWEDWLFEAFEWRTSQFNKNRLLKSLYLIEV